MSKTLDEQKLEACIRLLDQLDEFNVAIRNHLNDCISVEASRKVVSLTLAINNLEYCISSMKSVFYVLVLIKNKKS